MGWFDRMATIFKAKGNAAIEKAEMEDPVGIMKVEIQKIRKEMSECESAIASLGGQVKSTAKQRDEAKAQTTKWQKRAEAFMEDGNEEGAMKALAEKNKFATQAKTLETTHKRLEQSWNTAKKNLIKQMQMINDRESQLKTMDAQFKSVKANEKMNATLSKYSEGGNSLNKIDELSAKLDDKMFAAEAQSELMNEVSGADFEEECVALDVDSAVDDDMAKLRAKMAKKAK